MNIISVIFFLDKHPQNTLEKYNSLLQKKIVDLEKQLLLHQTLSKQNSNVYDHEVSLI